MELLDSNTMEISWTIYNSKYVIVEKVISRTRYWNFTVLVDFKTGKMNYGLKITVLLLVFSNVSFVARSAKGKSQKLGLITSQNEQNVCLHT